MGSWMQLCSAHHSDKRKDDRFFTVVMSYVVAYSITGLWLTLYLPGTRGSVCNRAEVQPSKSPSCWTRQVCHRRGICWTGRAQQLPGTSLWRGSHRGQRQPGDDDDDGHQQSARHWDRQEQTEPQSEEKEEAEQEQIGRLNCINIFYQYTQSNINIHSKTKF